MVERTYMYERRKRDREERGRSKYGKMLIVLDSSGWVHWFIVLLPQLSCMFHVQNKIGEKKGPSQKRTQTHTGLL